MEFEMTRPMLDFVIRLHKNGENPYDKGSKKRDARYRIKDKKFLLVDIKVWRTRLQRKEICTRAFINVDAKVSSFRKNFYEGLSTYPVRLNCRFQVVRMLHAR